MVNKNSMFIVGVVFIIITIILIIFSSYNQKMIYDNDIYYDPANFHSFDNLQLNYLKIKDEAMHVYKNTPVLDISRKYDDWKYLSDDYINGLKNKLGWIGSWKKVESDEKNDKWLNYGLFYYGHWFDENIKLCPNTYKLLKEIEPKLNIVGFSLMKANSKIPPHVDTTGKNTNSLTYHLGLIVPNPTGSCELTVKGLNVAEENGKSIIFDSNYEHSATNDSNYDRIILYIDFKI